jgi:hypothetical protein
MISVKQIKDQVRSVLSPSDRSRSTDIDRSYEFAIADLTNKFMQRNRLKIQKVSVSASARTVTLPGISYELSKIFYIRYGTGDDQRLLTHIDLPEFLKKYSSPSAAAGTPLYYTDIGLDDDTQLPEIKFDVPAQAATTMELYYFTEANPNQIQDSMAPALANCTLAYFYGIGTEAGAPYYQAYRMNVGDAKAKEKVVVDKESRFIQDKPEEDIAVARISRRDGRL